VRLLAFRAAAPRFYHFRTARIFRASKILPRWIPASSFIWLIRLIYSKSRAYITSLLMRRFFSITTIATLMFSMVSPLLAAACPHSPQLMACHRPPAALAQQHHCDTMMQEHHAEEAAPAESSAPAVKGVQSPENCLMDCCAPRHVTSASAIAAASSLPPLVVTQQVFQFVPVVFARTGFSSHTDRGPPTQ
jgi:hypothetical protein